ncbi:alpha-2-macroglobulin family protein [Terrimonas sp.]|uniref:alpha-2-macroglobulin family protein n=1 Tax=Terrimonas sp. TaxID=1914338 RepID=UPI001F0C265A|nr:alpha-2-macroglobulin family protein [Terrimonas sp.]
MNPYDSAWKKVDNLINKDGLVKTALGEVDKIYVKARKEKNNPQLIKALVYQLNLSAATTENAETAQIQKIEKEIAGAGEPASQILQSITAEMYWHYFQNNRWKFYNRTNTTNFNKEDIATWTLDDLHKKISELYLASLQNEQLLQKTSLTDFEAVIIKGNTRKLRPTLYDLLTHRALDYFENDERDITKPAYAFTINDDAAFETTANFIQHNFTTKDTAALQYKALLIYQQLLAFHKNDTSPEALIDTEARRLAFVHEHGVMPNKEALYEKALQQLAAQNEKSPAVSQLWAALAQYYYNKGNNDEANSNPDSTALKTAKDICEKTIKLYSKTEGAADCRNLLNNILRKSVELFTEKVNVPGEAFRTLVKYKNFNTAYFRIIPLTKTFKNSLQNKYEDTYWQKLTSAPATKEWEQNLPATDDYLEHGVEIKVDGLPVGEYALLASMNKDFSTGKNLLAAQFFYVSAISFVNSQQEYFVLHRNTGKPLAEAAVQVWTSKYDYTDRKNKLQKGELLTADKNGYFQLPARGREDRNIRLEIKWQKDHLFMDDYQYIYNRYDAYNSNEKTKEAFEKQSSQVFFFTDRSIYRPGQTLYFKAIAVTKNRETRKVMLLEQKLMTVMLKDANQQVIDSLSLTSGEYGSIQGQFRLPQNTLNGNFTLSVKEYNRGIGYFSVEEYKRPKFFVEINKPRGSFRVNDTVSITGTAKAYAGNNIDDATVSYRVSRQARFIYPWLFYRRPMPNVPNMEITSGTTTTDANGNFKLDFAAIPDLSIDKKLDPVFDYSVQVDITDINGETRSETSVIPVGYKSVVLNIDLPGSPVATDSLKNIFVGSANLSGEPEKLNATVMIYPLQAPQRLIRERYWDKPDKFVFSEAEYINHFPHDEYKDEADYRNWTRGSSMYAATDTTNKKFQVSNQSTRADIKFPSGWYAIEAIAKDKDGNDIKAIEYVQLYDAAAKTIPLPEYNWYTDIKANAQPGETAGFITGTAATDVFLIQQTDKTIEGRNESNQQISYQFFSINNEKKNFSFPITEDDRGGFGIVQLFVKDNRVYINNNIISVPWTNKQLAVNLSTFREKMEPGSEEKWQVKISGSKGEKVAAEMLASMYDASLDQFKPHRWVVPNIWPQYYAYSNWDGRQSFTDIQSEERNTFPVDNAYYEKNYDRLITVSVMPGSLQDVVVVGYGGGRKRAVARMAAPMISKNEMAEGLVSASEAEGDSAEYSKMQKKSLTGSVVIVENKNTENKNLPVTTTRKNFNETAFFFPDLKTDEAGNIAFSFTMPEALTQWKMMAIAHSKALAFGYAQQLAVTQKELMIQPNAPRFVREKDSIAFSAKIVNIGDKPLNGFAKLELVDAATLQPVDHLFNNAVPVKEFTVAAGQSTPVQFLICVPQNFNTALQYRITATANTGDGKTLSDGEENILPVLTNQMLVTEALPLNMRGSGTKNFIFEKLLKSGVSHSQKNFGLTVEYTSNPAWYAVQALPYLAEFPYECAEQTFNRYYANILATNIANSSPRIKAVFSKWLTDSASNKGLVSALEKNEELKSVVLQETPWLMQAKSETEQKKNIALLFDMVRMSNEATSNFNKLKDMQTFNGGFVWFKDGRDDRFITQYIITGIGHLQKLHALPAESMTEWKDVVSRALVYTDNRIKEEYEQLVKTKAKLKENQLSNAAIQYLYMRSFYTDNKITATAATAYNYYTEQAKKYWLKQSRYMQGMIALALFRTGDTKTANAIIASLKENAVTHEEMGMYWKDIRSGYYWYQAPVETQSLLIEAFSEITKDSQAVNDMKLWLLKQKQTQHWGNTKATAEACYALLLQGSDWLANEPQVSVTLGKTTVSNTGNSEAGTGYFKTNIPAADIKPEMGNIKVAVSSSAKQTSGSWGAVYWQYFEDLDKITPSSGETMPLQLKKQLFIQKHTDRGPVLEPVNNNAHLKVGDKLIVRIALRADRDMEYVHMKDMRAAGTEPVNVLSSYKWQGGLGYYESTKDVSTNFFFGWLSKGTYVFEYPLFVTHEGNFSSGVATIQCMYAPEFISHSEGVRIMVK